MVLQFLLLIFFQLHCVQTSKIVLLPWPDGFSHVKVLDKIGVELIKRGHEVVFLLSEMTSKSDKVALKENIKIYKSSYPKGHFLNLTMPESVKYGFITFSKVCEIFTVVFDTCDELLSDNDILNSLKDADLLLSDNSFPCGSLVSKRLSLHQVDLSLWGFMDGGIASQYHIPSPFSYIPIIGGVTPKMSFLQRTGNYLASFIVQAIWFNVMMGPIFDDLNRKHQIIPDKSFSEFAGDVDMVLVPTDWAVEWSRPILPGVKVVGFIGPEPVSPLPPDLDEFVQSAEDGIIIVSFGSSVEFLEEKQIKHMTEAFSLFPQKILWSNNGNYSVPENYNIKALNWLPQNDLVGHPKTKLFISHCGLGATGEAVYHGVPVLAVPLFSDQYLYAMKLVTAGMAIQFDVRKDLEDKEKFQETLEELLVNQSYTANAQRVSRLARDRLRTPVEESADWVEYVLRANGTKFLQPEAVNMPLYKHDLIDVKIFLSSILCFIIFIIVKLFSCLCRCCGKLRQKEKKL